MFEVGDIVELKVLDQYTYGLGQADAGDIGEVIWVGEESGDLRVDFDTHEGWLGKPSEFTLIEKGDGVPTARIGVAPFPQCCTARVIHSFGGTHTAIVTDRVPKESIIRAIKRKISHYEEHGIAMLVATTNDEQVEANKALRELGFSHSPWMEKEEHFETRVRLWWKHIG